MHELIRPDLQAYAEAHTGEEPDYLLAIREETERSIPSSRMISGHLQGRFLSAISRMLRPNVVLEIGTYTGYSALCLAEGLALKGRVYTIEKRAELEPFIRQNLARTDLGNKVHLMMGDAMEILQDWQQPPDLVFLDADKKNYRKSYELVLPNMPSGGWILADNVLWSGKVTEQATDGKTQAIREFNDFVRHDARVQAILLPVRDGISMIQKR